MDNMRDERLDCVSCGNSFIFTAAEAERFLERGLSMPPKRCHDCRRARKEQQQRDGFQGGAPRYGDSRFRSDSRGGYRSDAGPSAGYRPRSPGYTGDVNEYRSPMGMGHSPSGGPPRHVMGGGSEYRSPMSSNSGGARPFERSWGGDASHHRAPSGGGYGGNGAPRYDDRGGYGMSRGPRSPRPYRSHDEGDMSPRQMYSITCKSCGVESQVPFRPDEGRDVFCQPCYRARRPY